MNEITLYGSVGASFWDEEYFTPTQVRAQLAGLSGPLTVRINSGGGFAADGQTIYTMLKDYPGEVHVIVDGAAASAASLIAMAGDTITMRLGSFLLIHDPAQMMTEGRGTSEEHRRLADQLETMANGYAAIYAARARIKVEDARAVMRADTLLDGESAVMMGFATLHDADHQAAAAARFDYRLYKNAPADLLGRAQELGAPPGVEAVMAVFAGAPRVKPTSQEEISTMAENIAKQTAEMSAVAPEAPKAKALDAKAITAAERTRVKRIMEAVAMAGQPREMAERMIDDGTSFEEAFETIRAAQIAAQEAKPAPELKREATARVMTDARDKFVEGAGRALMAKVGLKGGERNEFSSLTLAELARESIAMSGERVTFTSRLDMIGRAFTMADASHTTSDFANILANVQGKAAMAGWDEAEETFEAWTRTGTLADFKQTKRVAAGLVSDLDAKSEAGEFKYGTIGDRGETIQLATYGKIIRISREAIINDDLGILGDLPRKMGRAAKRKVGDLVWAIITGTHLMSDGVTLFDSSHANLAGSAAAPTVTSLGAARSAMRIQKESSTGPSLNIRPAYILSPAALETTFSQLLNSAVDPTTSKGHASNPVAGLGELIVEPRLDDASTTAWFLAANPMMHDTIEVGYLDGNAGPRLEQQTGWTTEGVEMKVAIDATAKALDWRTLYKNAGA